MIAAVGPQAGRLSGIVSAAVGALQVRTGGLVRSAPGADGEPGPTVAVRHWMRDTLNCGGPAAATTVRVAVGLRELPLVAAAVSEGRISLEHAGILTRFLSCVDLQQP